MRHILWQVILAALAFAAAGRAQEAATPFPIVPGWTVTPDTAVYTPDNLYDLIDGAADVYLSYGFTDLHLADYRDSQGTEVRVELYRHDTPANAFGIYSQERKPAYHFIPVGAQGYRDEGVLNFLTGRYYVKISTHAPGPGSQQALKAIGTTVALHLKQQSGFPAPLRLFPPGGKIANSETYVAENFLGYHALRGAYVARYRGFALFIIPADDSARARSALREYLEAVRQPLDSVGVSGGIVRDPNNGAVGVLVQGNILAGVMNLKGDRQIDRELARLRGHLQRR